MEASYWSFHTGDCRGGTLNGFETITENPRTRAVKLVLSFILIICLSVLIGIANDASNPDTAYAAGKPSISKKSKTLYKGQLTQLSVKNSNGKIKWSSSNSRVASVSSSGVVSSKKKGKATIRAKVSGKTYKCKITVKEASKSKREALAKAKAKKIAKKLLKPGMNKATKAYVLANFLIVTNTIQTNQSNSSYKRNYGNEAYAALVMNKAACSGYCKAYSMLCKQAGIAVRHVNANSWTHQWNEVKIDGKWYTVDTQGGYIGLKASKISRSGKDLFEKMICEECKMVVPLSQQTKHYDDAHDGNSWVSGHLIGYDKCRFCKNYRASFQQYKYC